MAWLVRFSLDLDADGGDGSAGPDSANAVEMIMSELWDEGTTGLYQNDDGQIVAGFATDREARAAGQRLSVSRGRIIDSFTVEPVGAVALPLGGDAPIPVAVISPRHRFELMIKAGGAFGHGGHPTTRLALELMMEAMSGHQAVLDVGTGTGILAVAAAKAGATVTAIDTDPEAIAVAVENAARNDVDMRCEALSINELRVDGGGPESGFDVVVANVLLPVHRDLAGDIAAALRRGGSLITAGYLVDQVDEVLALYLTAARTQWNDEPEVVDHRTADGWSAHRLTRR